MIYSLCEGFAPHGATRAFRSPWTFGAMSLCLFAIIFMFSLMNMRINKDKE